MRITIAQTNIQYEAYEVNKAAAASILQTAKSRKTDLLLFPEMSFTGFSMQTTNSIAVGTDTVAWMQQEAMIHNLHIGFGWVGAAPDGKAENHYSIAAPDGSCILDYIKIHPFSYADEHLYFVKGERLAACQIGGLRIGCAICYDLRFSELFSALSEHVDLIVVPANWPARRRHHWRTLLSARAIENQVYMAGVNCVGTQQGAAYSGDSALISPVGEMLLDCGDAAGCFTMEISAQTVAEARVAFPVRNDRRPDLYKAFSL